MPVRNRIKEYRNKRNVNQEELAEAIGSSRRNLVNIEVGKSNTSVETALRLACYLNTSVEELFQITEYD